MATWTIEPSLGSHRTRDEVGKLKTELEDLEVLVREVVQNSLDAGIGRGFVSVRFRTRRLRGQTKSEFLDHLAIKEYARHAKLSMEFQRRIALTRAVGRNEIVIDDQALRAIEPHDPSTPLDLLYVEDFGTTGLTGEEFDSEAGSRFCACCRDSEFSVKDLKQSGGSYGKGKNVLWRHARSRLVLFNSLLHEPYRGETLRFIGVGKLPWHAQDGATREHGRYTGRCEFGEAGGRSLLGAESQPLAAALGMARAPGETGTSICLVGFQPISSYTWEELPGRICRIAEDYYWPAILEGRIQIRAVGEDGTTHDAEPDRRAGLQPFVAAYQAARGRLAGRVESAELSVPVRGKGDKLSARITVGCDVLPDTGVDLDEARPEHDHVALIRGAGMVVNYVPVRPQRISAERYAGVCLAGLADPAVQNPSRTEAEDPAAVLEALLAFSEPEAHDRWDPNSFAGIENWRGAQMAVRKVRDIIRELVTRLVGGDNDPEEGRSIPELARRFRVTGGESSIARHLSIRQATAPKVDGDGLVRYVFALEQVRKPSFEPARLRLRLQAIQIDAVSSARARYEPLRVLSVCLGGVPVPFDAKRDSSYVELALASHPLPLAVEVVAQSAPDVSIRTAHCGLSVSCELLPASEEHGEAS